MTRPRSHSQAGFTLIELLIVVAIIGVIAAIAIPNLLSAVQRGKQRNTMGNMRTIATALDAYVVDNDNYPNYSGTASLLISSLESTYLKNVPTTDGWGNNLIYAKLDPATDGSEYILWSLGQGGIDDGNNGDDGPTTSFEADIVIFDGAFTQWPEGAQQ